VSYERLAEEQRSRRVRRRRGPISVPVVEGAKLAVPHRAHRQADEELNVVGHVPAAPAANPQPLFGRDDRPEPVPLELVGEVAAHGQPPEPASIGSESEL
jgi:hypothetical protein